MGIIKGITASVVIDHKYAREYPCPGSVTRLPRPDNQDTVYIQAKSEASFYFQVIIDSDFDWDDTDLVSAVVELNGREAASNSVNKDEPDSDGTWCMTLDGVCKQINEEDYKQHKWIFEQMDTRPRRRNEDVSTWDETYAKLGTLTVNVGRAYLLNQPVSGRPETKRHTVWGLVPEDAVKDKTVGLITGIKPCFGGKPQTFVPVEYFNDEYVTPLAQFNFRYRTREALKNLGLIKKKSRAKARPDKNINKMTRKELQASLEQARAAEKTRKERKKARRAARLTGQAARENAGMAESQPPKRILKREYMSNIDDIRYQTPERGFVSDSDDVQVIEPSPQRRKKSRPGRKKLDLIKKGAAEQTEVQESSWEKDSESDSDDLMNIEPPASQHKRKKANELKTREKPERLSRGWPMGY